MKISYKLIKGRQPINGIVDKRHELVICEKKIKIAHKPLKNLRTLTNGQGNLSEFIHNTSVIFFFILGVAISRVERW